MVSRIVDNHYNLSSQYRPQVQVWGYVEKISTRPKKSGNKMDRKCPDHKKTTILLTSVCINNSVVYDHLWIDKPKKSKNIETGTYITFTGTLMTYQSGDHRKYQVRKIKNILLLFQ